VGIDINKEWNLVGVAILIGVPFVLVGIIALSAWKPTYLSQAELQGMIRSYNGELAKDPASREFRDPMGDVFEEAGGAKILSGKVRQPLAYGLIYGGTHEVTFVTDKGMTLDGWIRIAPTGARSFSVDLGKKDEE